MVGDYPLGPRSPTVAQANDYVCDWMEKYNASGWLTQAGIDWVMHVLAGCGYPTLRARSDQVEIFMRWGVIL